MTNTAAKLVWSGTSHSVQQTQTIARFVAAHAQPGSMIALVGELGAGKTCFVAGLAQALGIDRHHIVSPTFVFMHEYDNPTGGPVLVHVDAYRLNNAEDMDSIGWEVGGGELACGAIVAIEWADRINESLGDDYLRVELVHTADNTREITITPKGAWTKRMPDIHAALTKGGVR